MVVERLPGSHGRLADDSSLFSLESENQFLSPHHLSLSLPICRLFRYCCGAGTIGDQGFSFSVPLWSVDDIDPHTILVTRNSMHTDSYVRTVLHSTVYSTVPRGY